MKTVKKNRRAGHVMAIDPALCTLAIFECGKAASFLVAPEASVAVGKTGAALSDVKVGMSVCLSLDATGVVVAIDAKATADEDE